MHAVGLSSLPHNKTLLTSFSIFLSLFLCLCKAVWWLSDCYILPVYSFTCVSFLPSHLYLFCLPLVSSVSISSLSLFFSVLCLFVALLSFSLPLSSSPLPFSASPFLSLRSPFLFLHLSSPPFPPLLPLFRLCKVQLGFGAFGLQAWRQEDALSEYALLGSLCVTLYFFALLFLPVVLTYFCSYLFTPISIKSRSSCLPVGFLLWWGMTLCFWNHQCPAENWCLQKRQLFRH